MNVMIKSDLITMKNSAAQLAITCIIVAVVIAVIAESLTVSIAAVVAMIPFMYVFSISAYDEMNGWERFRLTLPISRRQVVYGRYASMFFVTALCDAAALLFALVVTGAMSLLPETATIPGLSSAENPPQQTLTVVISASSVILLTAALTFPLIMRYGMTKGTRLAPVVLVLMLSLGIVLVEDSGILEALFPQETATELWTLIGSSGDLIAAICVCTVLILFAASAFLSARLYEKRQFQ